MYPSSRPLGGEALFPDLCRGTEHQLPTVVVTCPLMWAFAPCCPRLATALPHHCLLLSTPSKLLTLQSYCQRLLQGTPTLKWFHLADKKTEAHTDEITFESPFQEVAELETNLGSVESSQHLSPRTREEKGCGQARSQKYLRGKVLMAWILTRLPVSAFIPHLKTSQYTSLRRAVKWHWIIEFWTSQTNANIWQIDLIAFTYNKAEL